MLEALRSLSMAAPCLPQRMLAEVGSACAHNVYHVVTILWGLPQKGHTRRQAHIEWCRAHFRIHFDVNHIVYT